MQRLQSGERKPLAEDRSRLQRLPILRRQRVHASQHNALDGAWDDARPLLCSAQ